MKNQYQLLAVLLVITMMFSACNPIDSTSESEPQPSLPSPDPTITSIPTSEPTDLPTSTIEPTSLPIPTLSPADITISIEGKAQCTYDGPQPIPAVESLTVNFYIKSTEATWYAFLATFVGEGHTKEDLWAEARNAFPPPPWTAELGELGGPPNSSIQGTIQASSGPLRGPIYFICWSGGGWDSLKPFSILGPFDVQ